MIDSPEICLSTFCWYDVVQSHRHIASHRLGAQSFLVPLGGEAHVNGLVLKLNVRCSLRRCATQIKLHLTYQKPRTFIYHHFSIFAPSQNINLMPSTNTWRQITISANRFWPLAKVRRCRAMEIIGVGDEWEGAPPSQKTSDKLGDTGEDKPKLSEASDSKETSKAINA